MKLARAARSELLFATLILALGLFVLYDSYTLQEPGIYSAVSPKAFAYAIGIFTTLVGLFLLIEVIRGHYGIAEGTEPGAPFLPPDIKTMSIVLVSALVHIALLERIGYIISAAILFYGVTYAFGSRKFLKDILISIAFGLIVYIVFSKGLRIFLPEGFLENLLGLARDTQ